MLGYSFDKTPSNLRDYPVVKVNPSFGTTMQNLTPFEYSLFVLAPAACYAAGYMCARIPLRHKNGRLCASFGALFAPMYGHINCYNRFVGVSENSYLAQQYGKATQAEKDEFLRRAGQPLAYPLIDSPHLRK